MDRQKQIEKLANEDQLALEILGLISRAPRCVDRMAGPWALVCRHSGLVLESHACPNRAELARRTVNTLSHGRYVLEYRRDG